MITWNDIKNLDVTAPDLTKLDLTKLDLTKLDLSRFDVRKADLPKFDMPKFDVTKFDLAGVELPAEVTRLAGFARDAAYVGVGAVVVSAQKADERRREMADQVAVRVRKLADAIA